MKLVSFNNSCGTTNPFLRTLKYVSLIVGGLTLISATVQGQGENIQFTQGSVGSGLENNIQISIWNYPGRGATSLPVTLNYSSRVWRIGHLKTVNNQSYYQSIVEAIYGEYSIAGWRSSLDLPTVEWPQPDDTYYHYGGPFCDVCGSSANRYKVARVFIHMPDGSTHELRVNDQPYLYQGTMVQTGTFYAVDGSRLRYDSTSATTGTLYLADGTRYLLNGSTAQYIDRNGNTLNYDASTRQWTDTLGRQITNPLPVNPDPTQPTHYTPHGFSTPYTFIWKNLADVLTPDANNQTPDRRVVGTEYLPHLDQAPTNNSGNNYPHENTTPALFSFGVPEDADDGAPYTLVVGRGESQAHLFNPVVLAEIDLPNGLSYKFTYNIYGEIDNITYPTGAIEHDTYSTLPAIGDVKNPYSQSNRGVTDRKVSAAGVSTAEWTYESTGGLVTTTNPDLTQTKTYRKNIETPMHTGAHGSITHFWPFGYEDALQGSVVEEQVYAPTAQCGQTMWRRTLTAYDETSNTVTALLPSADPSNHTAYRNARPNKTVSLILDTCSDALAKTVTYEYAANGYELSTGLDRTASNESYFASVNQTTAQSGSISDIEAAEQGLVQASRAETTYLDNAIYRNLNILGLPTIVLLKDGNNNIVSRSDSFYDESAYPLLTYSDLTSYNDPNTTARGNVTTARRYVDIGAGSYLETHAQFDQCGNLRVGTNERGAQSSIDYVGGTYYRHAFATQTTSAVPDPTDAHGSNSAFTSSSTFDVTTGLALTTTDANGQVTTYSYVDDQNNPDPLNRLRKVTRPDGGWTKYTFGETLPSLFTKTETQQDATRTVIAYQYVDALGRASRSFSSEGGGSYIADDTIYDSMGRVSKTSNPYRTTALGGVADVSHTSDWTTSQYDALGRVSVVVLPDASTVHTEYQGIYTTVTDQANRQRRQKTDALGRIVRVDEPNSGSLGTDVDHPAQPSFYQYDARGNLIAISQGWNPANGNLEDPTNYLQHRFFKYDALGRLIYEKQAEQAGTFTASDSLTGNTSWSRKLVYDQSGYSGLLTTAYDARNISTQFDYDSLNRIYKVTYSDATPAISNYYDQTVSGYFNKGHLTLATTAQGLTSANDVLPATSERYNYDLMGRVKSNEQSVGAQSYLMSYEYNLGGAMTDEHYPSGRTVSYAFDAGSRLSQVSSGSTVYANQFDYSTGQGLLKSVTLGNGSVETYDYNSRLQLKSLDLTKGTNQLQHYDYKYGVYDPRTNTLDDTKNTGQIARIEGFIGGNLQWQQNFAYDELGRLYSAREYRGDNLNSQVWQLTYSYDVFGNRNLPQSQNSGNAINQNWVESGEINAITNRFTNGVTYDDAGNITVDSKFRNLSLQYDANNRQKQSSDGTGTFVSVYDAGGQRVATQVSGTLTNVLVYDAGGKLVAEYGGAVPGGTQYGLADQQGSPRVITDGNGNVISRHDYAPFGEELGAIGMRSGVPGYGSGDNVRQKYAGMESEDGSGLDHTLWRQYDNLSGRWTSPDPYGGSMTPESPQSFNRYGYVNNDPINKVDQTGLMLSDIGVYQTANPECARLTERAEDQGIKNWVTQHQEQPHKNDHRSHFGGVGHATSNSEGNHSGGSAQPEHSNSAPASQDEHTRPQESSMEPIESDPKITACHITVRPGYLVGEDSNMRGRFFSVDISVKTGGIKSFPEWKHKSRGGWTIEQGAWESFTAVGDIASDGGIIDTHTDNPEEGGVNYIRGNKAHYIDAPGYFVINDKIGHLQYFEGWQNIYIKASNKDVSCYVEFGIYKSYENGKPVITLRHAPF